METVSEIYLRMCEEKAALKQEASVVRQENLEKLNQAIYQARYMMSKKFVDVLIQLKDIKIYTSSVYSDEPQFIVYLYFDLLFECMLPIRIKLKTGIDGEEPIVSCQNESDKFSHFAVLQSGKERAMYPLYFETYEEAVFAATKGYVALFEDLF